MATQTLATIANALSQLFAPELTPQYNRHAVTASKLTGKPGRGKNVAFDVTIGARTSGAYTDGGNYPTATVDAKLPAVMPWAYYAAPFSISTGAVDAAATSMGTPEELMDVFRDSVLDAMRSLASTINADVITGTGSDGTNTTITGFLGGALAASGTYATIDRGTYPTFGGNVLSNSGTNRALSIPLLDAVDQALFTACGQSADLIICSPQHATNYKGLFTTYTQFLVGGQGQATSLGAGTNSLTYNSTPIIRDKDLPWVTADSTHHNQLLFLNTNEAEIVFLPFATQGLPGTFAQSGGELEGSSGMGTGNAVQVPFLIEALPRTGSVYNFVLRAQCQLRVRRPNAFAILGDLT